MRLNKLLPFLLLGLSTPVIAQHKIAGDWQGILNVPGSELHVVFHIKDSSGTTMDVIEQGVNDIPASGVILNGDSVRINISKLGAYFAGKINSTDEIKGRWFQGGASLPMDIRRNEKPVALKLNRPQTPKAPFSYISEDVIFQNADKSIQYGATLTLPKGTGPFPAILLISGSGAQNRDEELFGHKPFAVIADHLTSHGYAVLRVDDRGVGKTSGERTSTTSADYVKDAAAAVDYLNSRKEINKKKIGLAGHSEGGMIAQILATQRKDIDFLIFLAGPGIKSTELMMEQNGAILKRGGASDEIVTEYLKLYNSITQGVVAAKTTTEVKSNIADAIKKWRAVTDPQIVMATTGITDNTSEDVVAEKISQQFIDPWIRYFLAYDPQPYLEQINAKVLALNGDKDVQVISASNLKGIETALSKSKAKYTTKELPGLNHLFQTCSRCTVDEYAKLEETFAPMALNVMVEWLDKNVK